MPIRTRKNLSGFVDPISIIGVLFLVVTLTIGTAVTTNKGFSLNISEKAAGNSNTGNSCFDNCRKTKGTQFCNNECGVNINYKGEDKTVYVPPTATNNPTTTTYTNSNCSGACTGNQTCVNIGYGYYGCQAVSQKVGDKQCNGNFLQTWDGTKWNSEKCDAGCNNTKCNPVLTVEPVNPPSVPTTEEQIGLTQSTNQQPSTVTSTYAQGCSQLKCAIDERCTQQTNGSWACTKVTVNNTDSTTATDNLEQQRLTESIKKDPNYNINIEKCGGNGWDYQWINNTCVMSATKRQEIENQLAQAKKARDEQTNTTDQIINKTDEMIENIKTPDQYAVCNGNDSCNTAMATLDTVIPDNYINYWQGQTANQEVNLKNLALATYKMVALDFIANPVLEKLGLRDEADSYLDIAFNQQTTLDTADLITFDKSSRYVSNYQRINEQTYDPNSNGVVNYLNSFNAGIRDKETLASTIDLGTTLTAEAYALTVAAPLALTSGGVIPGAVSLMGQAQVISTAMQTGSTASYCTVNGWDEVCKGQTARTALSWTTMGVSQYANTANSALGRVANTITSGANLAVDSADAVTAFSDPNTDSLTKAMSLIAVVGDIGGGIADFKQGQLGFGGIEINTIKTDINKIITADLPKSQINQMDTAPNRPASWADTSGEFNPYFADDVTKTLTHIALEPNVPRSDIPLVEIEPVKVADVDAPAPSKPVTVVKPADVPVVEKITNWVEENIIAITNKKSIIDLDSPNIKDGLAIDSTPNISAPDLTAKFQIGRIPEAPKLENAKSNTGSGDFSINPSVPTIEKYTISNGGPPPKKIDLSDALPRDLSKPQQAIIDYSLGTITRQELDDIIVEFYGEKVTYEFVSFEKLKQLSPTADLGTTGFNSRKGIAKIFLLDPVEVSRVHGITYDEAVLIQLQTLGHEFGEAYDGMIRSNPLDAWASEYRARTFDQMFIEELGLQTNPMFKQQYNEVKIFLSDIEKQSNVVTTTPPSLLAKLQGQVEKVFTKEPPKQIYVSKTDTKVVVASSDEIILYRGQKGLGSDFDTTLPGGLRNGNFTAQELSDLSTSQLMQTALDRGYYGNDNYRFLVMENIKKIKELEEAGFTKDQTAAFALQQADGNVISPFISFTTDPNIAKNFAENGDIIIIKVPRSRVSNMNELTNTINSHLNTYGTSYENEFLVRGNVNPDWIQANIPIEKFDELVEINGQNILSIKVIQNNVPLTTVDIETPSTPPSLLAKVQNDLENWWDDATHTVTGKKIKLDDGNTVYVDKNIAKGAQADVSKGHITTDSGRTEVAVKKLRTPTGEQADFIRAANAAEIEILNTTTSSVKPKYYGMPGNDTIVLEYIEGVSVEEFLRTATREQKVLIYTKIKEALPILYADTGLPHGDMNLVGQFQSQYNNLILTPDGQIKFIDQIGMTRYDSYVSENYLTKVENYTDQVTSVQNKELEIVENQIYSTKLDIIGGVRIQDNPPLAEDAVNRFFPDGNKPTEHVGDIYRVIANVELEDTLFITINRFTNQISIHPNPDIDIAEILNDERTIDVFTKIKQHFGDMQINTIPEIKTKIDDINVPKTIIELGTANSSSSRLINTAKALQKTQRGSVMPVFSILTSIPVALGYADQYFDLGITDKAVEMFNNTFGIETE